MGVLPGYEIRNVGSIDTCGSGFIREEASTSSLFVD